VRLWDGHTRRERGVWLVGEDRVLSQHASARNSCSCSA
jgi:hypothetical protein